MKPTDKNIKRPQIRLKKTPHTKTLDSESVKRQLTIMALSGAKPPTVRGSESLRSPHVPLPPKPITDADKESSKSKGKFPVVFSD